MRPTLQNISLFLYASIATVLMSGCVNTLTGDLGDLFSESNAGNLDKQETLDYKLDPLALRNDIPAEDPKLTASTTVKSLAKEDPMDESMVFELLPDVPESPNPLLPQITNQPLSPAEPDPGAGISTDEENDFTTLPPANTQVSLDRDVDFQPTSTQSQTPMAEPTESESPAAVVQIANNPLAPETPVDIAPFETDIAEREQPFEPLPPVKSPSRLYVSEDMQKLPPPFANHPDVENCEYPECEISDHEIHVDALPELARKQHDTPPVELAPIDEPDPVQFVNDIVDSSMDPQRIDELKNRSTRIASNPKTLFNKAPELIVPAVKPPASVKPLTWDEQLQKTVDAINTEIERSNGQQRRSLESAKVVLQSLHSSLTNANESVPGSVKQYWIHQIKALEKIIANSIDDQNVNDITTETLQELQLAAGALRESANLKLSSAVFCRKVIGFGQYETFQSNAFRPNQPVLVYCEIENFTPKIERRGDNEIYLTRISSSYEIKDENGKVVQSTDYPMVSDEARKLRNDFFMHLPIRFGDLRIGQYQLQIEVHDFGSGKKTQLKAPLQFSIR